MNERIKELVGRAEAYAYEHEEHWHDGPDWQELFNKKFAELIVRECIQVVDGMADPEEDSDRYVWALHNASEKIREHFGVE